jgi:hypothetical protein
LLNQSCQLSGMSTKQRRVSCQGWRTRSNPHYYSTLRQWGGCEMAKISLDETDLAIAENARRKFDWATDDVALEYRDCVSDDEWVSLCAGWRVILEHLIRTAATRAVARSSNPPPPSHGSNWSAPSGSNTPGEWEGHTAALLMADETAFLHVDLALDNRPLRRRAKLALLSVIKGRVRRLQGFGGYWAREAGTTASFGASRRVVRDFLKTRQNREVEAKEAADPLKRCAGVRGGDSDQRQLDRGEFAETTAALLWLATCQMGWYRNRGGRYRSDMLEILNNDFTRQGLSEEHGITIHVSSDGQKWWAWRKTITGW